ncbi:DUF4440 domain-containing protein [Nocardia arthritidis]|uniref:DUF4440 domain-containing protein n=1 Tax=Nocardia arthritidis TaxID=228602 RepID=A0A6G9YJG6_9NOCA|nr:DUF4440 domain-containing protein [Nocardia arthritidis]QIS13300.1 DUF4440 domain-containing protein [Nocardia arthritidis]
MFSHDDSAVRAFILRYDANMKAGDFAALPSYFDDQLLVVTPNTARCVGRAEFLAAAEKRAGAMAWAVPRTEFAEQTVTDFGGQYWMVAARWTLSLSRSGETLDLRSDLLVRRADDGLRICAYLTRQDIGEYERATAAP